MEQRDDFRFQREWRPGRLQRRHDHAIVRDRCRQSRVLDGIRRGLAGINDGSISQSFATGPVQTGAMPTHGVIAFGSGTLAPDVYWNTETTGQPSSGGNLPPTNGLTTAQMSDRASFAGYDFGPNGVWLMPAGATHPVLRWSAGQ